jgi:adenine-specific DNA-methyltransferase
MIKYLGSKRKIIPHIIEETNKLKLNSACDLFTGTTRVAQAFRESGIKRIHCNDLAYYSEIFGICYIESNPNELDLNRLQFYIDELNNLKPCGGYFTETYCEKSRFIQPFNGEKIDSIRNFLEELKNEITIVEFAILLTSLIEAADKVDSTVGLFMSYLKNWSKRSYNPLHLVMPSLSVDPGANQGYSGVVTRKDANEIASSVKTQLVYIDPPYNQHSYAGNYHVWDSLVLWDKSEVYGVACKRVDVKERKSEWNSKLRIRAAFEQLITNLNHIPYLLISFNNESYLSYDDVVEILENNNRRLEIKEIGYNRHICSQIGIYNPDGVKVGIEGHTENKEFLFLGKK